MFYEKCEYFFRIFSFANFIEAEKDTGTITPTVGQQESIKLQKSPIFFLSRILAIFPFSRNQRLRIGCLPLTYSLVVLLTFVIFSFQHAQKICKTEQSSTNILLYMGYLLTDSVMIIICIVTPIVNRKSIISILKGFSNVNEIIVSLLPEFKYHENLLRQKLQISFILYTTIWFVFAYFKASQENIFLSITYLEFYILPTVWSVIFQIDYFLVHLCRGFTFVNSQIEKLLLTSQTTTPESTQTSKIDTSRLNKLNLIHFTLHEILLEINGTYSAELLIIIPRVIFFSVLPLHYNIVTALVKDQNDLGTSQFWTHAFTLTYIILLILPVIYAVNAASNTINQAKKINLLIHDLIDEDQEEHVEYELLVFSIQLLHRKIDFSVNEFFSLKPSLTTSMFQLIITYVIILLQFQDTLASVSPIHIFLRPIVQTYIISNNASSQYSSELPVEETDFLNDVINDTLH